MKRMFFALSALVLLAPDASFAQKGKKEVERLSLSISYASANQFRVGIQGYGGGVNTINNNNQSSGVIYATPVFPGRPEPDGISTILYCGTVAGKWVATSSGNDNFNGQNYRSEGGFYNLLSNTAYYVWAVKQKGDILIASSDTIEIKTMKEPDEKMVFSDMRIFIHNIQAIQADVQIEIPGLQNSNLTMVSRLYYGLDSNQMFFLSQPTMMSSQQGFNSNWQMQNLIPGKTYFCQVKKIDGTPLSKVLNFTTSTFK